MSLFIHALVITITIETTVLILFFFIRKKSGTRQLKLSPVLIAGVAASGLTLPVVWFIFPAIIHNRYLFLVTAELFAFVAEIPIIRSIIRSSGSEAFFASLVANSSSFIAGILMGMSDL